MSTQVTYKKEGNIGVIIIDDNKVNAMSISLIDQIDNALTQAQDDDLGAVVIQGRAGIFSAGFDLSEMMGEPETLQTLLTKGANLCIRLLSFPVPTVMACTGHAYPMGAFLLMSADYRIGATGPFRLGMNEVAIGITIPWFALRIAASRLAPAYYFRTTVTGELFSPETAVQAGILDETVDANELFDRCFNKAVELSSINLKAHAQTKLRAREGVIRAIEEAIKEELTLENAIAVLSG